MQRRPSLHRRQGIFYAQLWNDGAGKCLSARSEAESRVRFGKVRVNSCDW